MPSFTPSHTAMNSFDVDARVKLLLLIAFSISVFLCSHWLGMALFVGAAFLLLLKLEGQRKSFLLMLTPVAGLSLMVVLVRLLDTNVHTTLEDTLASGIIALRFILLATASLYVALSTSSTQLMGALRWLLSPLNKLGIRTNSAITVLTMAISFMPRVAHDVEVVYRAQASRGAQFTSGSIWQRLKSWSNIFIPVFISLFRHADSIALAMDARCYGAPGITPSSLHRLTWSSKDTFCLCLGLIVCVIATIL